MPRIVLNYRPNPPNNSNSVLEGFVAAAGDDAGSAPAVPAAAEATASSSTPNDAHRLLNSAMEVALRTRVAQLARQEVLRMMSDIARPLPQVPPSPTLLPASVAPPVAASTPTDVVIGSPNSAFRPRINTRGSSGSANELGGVSDNPVEPNGDNVVLVGQRSGDPSPRSDIIQQETGRSLYEQFRDLVQGRMGAAGNPEAGLEANGAGNSSSQESQDAQSFAVSLDLALSRVFPAPTEASTSSSSGNATGNTTGASANASVAVEQSAPENPSGEIGSQNQEQQQEPTPANPDAMVWNSLILESSGGAEDYAPDISTTMADLITKSVCELVSSEVRKQRVQAIKKPRNLNSLGVDRIPDNIWEGMSRTSRQKDLIIREITEDLLVGLSGVASSVATGNQRMDARQFGMSMQLLAGIKLKLDNFRKAATGHAFGNNWKILTDPRNHRTSQQNANNNPSNGYFNDLDSLASRLTNGTGDGAAGGSNERRSGERRRTARSGGYRRNDGEQRRRGTPYHRRWNDENRGRSGTPMPSRMEDASSDDAAED